MKNFDFVGKRKICYIISAAIIVVGLIFNLIFGTKMDISFTGGTELPFSYTGEINEAAVKDIVLEEIPDAQIEIGDGSIMITSPSSVENDAISAIEDALQKEFKSNNVNTSGDLRSLQASYGRTFFLKCMVAVALASALVVLYVGIRFRHIGGTSAAVVSLLALLHDILIAYFVFVIFRIPLNDNFVAVVLTILGYSLNDAIVIYDRIRENRRKLDKNTPISEVVNLSLNQSFTRTLNTSLCTLIAIGTVAVAAMIMGLTAVVSFALPMTVGVVAGFYSTTFLCTPAWAIGAERSTARKKAKSKSKKK